MVALGRYLKQNFGNQANPLVVSQVKKPSTLMNPPTGSPLLKDVRERIQQDFKTIEIL